LSPPAPGRPAQRGASADIGVRPKRNDTRPLVLQYSVLQYSGSPVFLLSSILALQYRERWAVVGSGGQAGQGHALKPERGSAARSGRLGLETAMAVPSFRGRELKISRYSHSTYLSSIVVLY
jgi:hypothetical protein